MATRTDRVGELLEGIRRNRHDLVSPEGVPLDSQIASHGERLTAVLLDMAFMLAAVYCLYLIFRISLFSSANSPVAMTLILFLAFIVRTLYFLHFELAWQGRTPGKKICGLRVINRQGGELTPSAIIARNLTREVEIFLPLSLFLNLDPGGGAWRQLTLLGWTAAITALPLFNRNHLRAGDLIGGTQVISMPKRVLLEDLTFDRPQSSQSDVTRNYVFTPEQLAVYGAFELQVLEEFLRRPITAETDHLLKEVCRKICRKTNWKEMIPPQDVRRFLNDFYTAQRANLERGQLFGHFKADKSGENGENDKRP